MVERRCAISVGEPLTFESGNVDEATRKYDRLIRRIHFLERRGFGIPTATAETRRLLPSVHLRSCINVAS